MHSDQSTVRTKYANFAIQGIIDTCSFSGWCSASAPSASAIDEVKEQEEPIADFTRRPTTLTIPMQLPERLDIALGLDRKEGPIKTLHVFDFDGTLVRTPGPEEGKALFTAATGRPWKGGWWGRAESLCAPVLVRPRERVVRSVLAELEDVVLRSASSVAVVVTGRIKPLRPSVLAILDDVTGGGDSFMRHDAVFTHPGGNFTTLEYKKHLMRALLSDAPLGACAIQNLHIWEDRNEHAQIFATEFANDLRATVNIETTVHFITPETP